MSAVLLMGHGGFEKLAYRTNIPTPSPSEGEVLIKVKAAGINNTDVNTRIAWYSKSVSGETNEGATSGFDESEGADGSWSGKPIRFPRIQGADCYGIIVAVGSGVEENRIGEHVLVRTMLRSPVDYRQYECWTFGSDCDGGFAQYAVAPSSDVYRVDSELSPEELGAIPCAYGTAEGMLVKANVNETDRVLVTGASGGVGSAAVQLAKIRGAEVIAIAARTKTDAVKKLGADQVIDRNADLVNSLGPESITVIVDLVAGSSWSAFLPLLKRGGRYVVAGAIAGPIVEMDVRTLYLKDLSLYGCAAQEDVVFENIVNYLKKGLLKPTVAKVFPLREIVDAQKMFIEKSFVGKIVLCPH